MKTKTGVGTYRPPKTVSLSVCELVEDMEIYPRHSVDDAHVSSIVMALESGVTLPPVVAEKKSKKIVDGWHRVRAYRRVLGVSGVIDVDLRTYQNEESLILDAVAMNSAHGRKFDAIDRARSVLMLDKRGVEIVKICAALHITEAKVEKLLIKVAKSPASVGTVPGTKKIALKRCVQHMEGETFTRKQAEAHGLMPGTSFLLVTNQLSTALREKMINLKDEKLVAALQELHKLLGENL